TTPSWWRRRWTPSRASATPGAWRASGPARRRTAAGRGATATSWRRSATRSTPTTRRRSNGPAASSTRRRSTSKPSTRSCVEGQSQLQGETTIKGEFAPCRLVKHDGGAYSLAFDDIDASAEVFEEMGQEGEGTAGTGRSRPWSA